MSAEANLVEIFSSVQGEGPDVGASTIFVRFGRCDLRCRWCDSPHTWAPAAEFRAVLPGGTETSPNPVACERVLDAGTGSGILSVAAALLGAESCLGFDIDPYSADACNDLTRDNGVQSQCNFRTGGFEVLEDTDREFDVVLALYHDQGHIAIKVHDFHHSTTVTMGIPFIRTSVDHGTAFDIAGQGVADEQGLMAAVAAADALVSGELARL